MRDFLVGQLPVVSSASEGDFVIINTGNVKTNRIDVKKLVEGFGDVKYLRTDVGAGDQTVASTSTTTFNGLTSHGDGVKVTGGKVSIGPDEADARTHVLISGASSTAGSNIAALSVREKFNRGDSGGLNGGNAAYLAAPQQTVVDADWNTHFRAVGISPATGITVNNVVGFYADNSLTVAGTNSYGFFSSLDNATNKFNFYAGGTAPNYFRSNLFIGDLPAATFYNGSTTDKAISYVAGSGVVGNPENASIRVQATTSSPVPILTTWNIDQSLGGSIQKAPNGDLSFVNPSDYRFKSDIVDLPNATEAIKALRPRQYTFKDIPNQIGFVAHELQQVVPDAVTGVKDGEKAIGTLLDWNGSIIFENGPEPPAEELEYTEDVETDGVTTQVVRTRSWTPTGTRPVYQCVDQTKLIPLLTKALQEALDKIEVLEQRLSDAGID